MQTTQPQFASYDAVITAVDSLTSTRDLLRLAKAVNNEFVSGRLRMTPEDWEDHLGRLGFLHEELEQAEQLRPRDASPSDV